MKEQINVTCEWPIGMMVGVIVAAPTLKAAALIG